MPLQGLGSERSSFRQVGGEGVAEAHQRPLVLVGPALAGQLDVDRVDDLGDLGQAGRGAEVADRQVGVGLAGVDERELTQRLQAGVDVVVLAGVVDEADELAVDLEGLLGVGFGVGGGVDDRGVEDVIGLEAGQEGDGHGYAPRYGDGLAYYKESYGKKQA